MSQVVVPDQSCYSSGVHVESPLLPPLLPLPSSPHLGPCCSRKRTRERKTKKSQNFFSHGNRLHQVAVVVPVAAAVGVIAAGQSRWIGFALFWHHLLLPLLLFQVLLLQ